MAALVNPAANRYAEFYSFYTKCTGKVIPDSEKSDEKYRELCPTLDTLAQIHGEKKRCKLSEKNLSDIPMEVIHFTGRIHSFNAKRNQLSELPVSLCYFGERLRKLDLSSNAITHIPLEIKLLINLEELSLEHNQLSELPDELGALSQLERLNLGHNRFQQIPVVIVHLTALKRLRFSGNLIQKLDDCLTQLVGLKRFYINANQELEKPSEKVMQWLSEREHVDATLTILG